MVWKHKFLKVLYCISREKTNFQKLWKPSFLSWAKFVFSQAKNLAKLGQNLRSFLSWGKKVKGEPCKCPKSLSQWTYPLWRCHPGVTIAIALLILVVIVESWKELRSGHLNNFIWFQARCRFTWPLVPANPSSMKKVMEKRWPDLREGSRIFQRAFHRVEGLFGEAEPQKSADQSCPGIRGTWDLWKKVCR